MAVVTNHNHFDRDEYTTLRRLGAKEGILVLPGVELGIKNGGGGIHTLIAFNPDGWEENPEPDDRISRFLSAQFQVFTDKGVDKKLADMTLFDGDRQAIVAWQQALKELDTNLRESADWDDAERKFINYGRVRPEKPNTPGRRQHAAVQARAVG